jgi:hypothetical protein
MQPWMIGIVIGALVVVAVVAWLIYDQRRSSRLRERFGPEYDRTVSNIGNRRRAETELARREVHAKQLRVRPLNPMDRENFLSQWKLCQAQFVDDPPGAVDRADELITEVMGTRGYSTDNPYERMTDIAAAYPRHVDDYREACRILIVHHKSEASTEELRTAFLHYRNLFHDLIGGYDEELKQAS